MNSAGLLAPRPHREHSGFAQLFTPTDKANKIFARTAIRSTLEFAPRLETHPAVSNRANVAFAEHPPRTVDVGKHLDHMLVARFSPPGVLVNDKMEILQFRGETGDYLQAPAGEPQTNLLEDGARRSRMRKRPSPGRTPWRRSAPPRGHTGRRFRNRGKPRARPRQAGDALPIFIRRHVLGKVQGVPGHRAAGPRA